MRGLLPLLGGHRYGSPLQVDVYPSEVVRFARPHRGLLEELDEGADLVAAPCNYVVDFGFEGDERHLLHAVVEWRIPRFAYHREKG